MNGFLDDLTMFETNFTPVNTSGGTVTVNRPTFEPFSLTPNYGGQAFQFQQQSISPLFLVAVVGLILLMSK